MKSLLKFSLLSLNLAMMIVLFSAIFNRANPLYIYTFSYPVQYIRAMLEASDLKPHWEMLSKNKGDCRIQNTIATIENPSSSFISAI